MQSRLRLNVAITRSQDALFVIANVRATLDLVTVTKALEKGQELDPESGGQDVIDLQQGQSVIKLQQDQTMLKKIIEFYISQECVRYVDIQTFKPVYVSYNKPEKFTTTVAIRC